VRPRRYLQHIRYHAWGRASVGRHHILALEKVMDDAAAKRLSRRGHLPIKAPRETQAGCPNRNEGPSFGGLDCELTVPSWLMAAALPSGWRKTWGAAGSTTSRKSGKALLLPVVVLQKRGAESDRLLTDAQTAASPV